MKIKKKKSSYFLNLMENDYYAMCSLNSSDSFDLTNNKLVELKCNLDKADRKYNISYAILSIVMILKNEDLTKKAALYVEKNLQIVNKHSDALKKFESELAYLLIKDVLSIEKAKILGFDDQYIEGLMAKYTKEVEKPYDEYFYNEKTGVLSLITEKGFYRPLPCISTSIANEIEKREVKKLEKS